MHVALQIHYCYKKTIYIIMQSIHMILYYNVLFQVEVGYV